MEIILKGKPPSVGIENKKGYRRLTDDYLFVIDGVVERIPAGFVWDGASIPRVFWARYGHPFDDEHETASLIHDALYSGLFGAAYTRKEADQIYRAVLRMSGVGWWQAAKEYRAVRWFGKSHFVAIGPMATIAASAIPAILCATLLVGCRSSDPTRSVDAMGLYANPATETVAIGKIEVVAAPSGEESAFIKYDEDYAWLAPSMKLRDMKIQLTGTNSVAQAVGIVSNICEALVRVKASDSRASSSDAEPSR